jgi:3-dehydroquinate synthase
MNSRTVQIDTACKGSKYEILIANGILNNAGNWSRDILGSGTRRILLVSDRKVYGLYGEKVLGSLERAGFKVGKAIIAEGERSKSWDTASYILSSLSEFGITRSDGIVALGGGVVGDLAGFAAAVHLRGVPFLQIPTTLLAMIDSSVGGKTGVNSVKGKNMIGAFHQPHGVLIDIHVLTTLETRELTSGLCEAVKHGAIAGRHILDPIADLVRDHPVIKLKQELANSDTFRSRLTSIIEMQVAFKAKVVAGDDREALDRHDQSSRKILNFGHTLAHALESVTDYQRFKHGEAVGYGILFAAELSNNLAFCDKKDVELLNDVVQSVGVFPSLAGIRPSEVSQAFGLDKKNIRGSLQWVLLRGIGKPAIISEENIPPSIMATVLAGFLSRFA